MPWVVGNGHCVQILDDSPTPLRITELTPGLFSGELLYAGYLLSGFLDSLRKGALRPEGIALAFKAGWTAVAVTAASQDGGAWQRFRPFVAPTAPTPWEKVPPGFCLMKLTRLQELCGQMALADASLDSLEWAKVLADSVQEGEPAFCDPTLELGLTGLTPAEASLVATYEPPTQWEVPWGSVRALLFDKRGWLARERP